MVTLCRREEVKRPVKLVIVSVVGLVVDLAVGFCSRPIHDAVCHVEKNVKACALSIERCTRSTREGVAQLMPEAHNCALLNLRAGNLRGLPGRLA
jgi:hypothetical protein